MTSRRNWRGSEVQQFTAAGELVYCIPPVEFLYERVWVGIGDAAGAQVAV
jgi:hypothetical protein